MRARGKTHCIVEDDPIKGEALRDRLELEGFAVDWLQTAGSAWTAIAGTRYDMLICDDRLPDGTGGELFATLNEAVQAVPPLRERQEDILWLADRFLEAHNEAHPEAPRVWGPAARESLAHYPWPGNVRELKHCIERAWVMSRGPALECEDLLSGFESAASGGRAPDSDLKSYLRGCERARIVEVLERNDWAIGRSAGEPGISRKNLWERMRRLEIDALS